jgi:hypothetical protein
MKEGLRMNVLERFHMYEASKQGIQLNDVFTDIKKSCI